MEWGTTTLTRSIEKLEDKIKKSKMPLSEDAPDADYSDSLIAFAIIRGLMEQKGGRTDNKYQTLKAELDSSINYVMSFQNVIIPKSFNKENLNKFLDEKIKLIKRYGMHTRSYKNNTLQRDISETLSNATSKKEYLILLTAIGRLIKDALKEEKRKFSEEERLSPNFMSEVSAIYCVFSKYKTR